MSSNENKTSPSNTIKTIEASFLLSTQKKQQWPQDKLPEIAFIGRSNSGKSSTINRLTRSKKLAKTSKMPGRTQLINFFNTHLDARLVDLPGYGYAKIAQKTQLDWEKHIADYLNSRQNLVAIFMIMDSRHPFKPEDLEILEWIIASEIPVHILLNKCDKLKKNEQRRLIPFLLKDQSITDSPFISIQLFSCLTNFGLEKALHYIYQAFSSP